MKTSILSAVLATALAFGACADAKTKHNPMVGGAAMYSHRPGPAHCTLVGIGEHSRLHVDWTPTGS